MSNAVSATRIVKAMREEIKKNHLDFRQEEAFRHSVFSLVVDVLPNYIGEGLLVAAKADPDSLQHTWRGSRDVTDFHDEIIEQIPGLALAASTITPDDYQEEYYDYDDYDE